MYYEKRIKKLNKRINKNNRKIKNLKIMSDIKFLAPGAVLLASSTAFTIYNIDNDLAVYLYGSEIFLSVVFGIILAPNDEFKLIQKINKRKEFIKRDLNELHEYALLENKKIMQKKNM